MAAERLQKVLSAHGIASRRAAERMITAGRVSVNGAVATLGMSADPEQDIIEVDGVLVAQKPDAVYLALNKPRGIITTTSDERGRKTVMDIVDSSKRVYPVGRLDLNSEGLLLLTNDGDTALALTHPSANLSKTYLVTLEPCSTAKLEQLQDLEDIDGEAVTPPNVKIVEQRGERWKVEIVIREGKNRQIRRMCEQCGMDVLRLKRIQIGAIKLGSLRPGESRELDKQEIRYIKGLVKGKTPKN